MKTKSGKIVVTNIDEMGTLTIIGRVLLRHRVFLLSLSNVLTLTIWLVTSGK